MGISGHNLKTIHNILLRQKSLTNRRYFASQSEFSSENIRQRFLDYFVKKHGHTFIRSSPVVPYCDPSLAFVNAGMNQFKSVFTGEVEPPCKTAANSQKCIRVGGKHNDLDIVGTDSYHHTFFEMLGSWSFGDYFKKDACTLAWNLLTRVYAIQPARLYVTYFAGDPAGRLQPDLETKEIWREIGVAEDRILGFGPAENLWEMGPTGPCGPCTEIHVDHRADRNNAGHLVNAGSPEVTELWNIVFMQYNRSADRALTPLANSHVDTGMGLERLVALLQGKQSNYDTDLFMPIIAAIQKMSGAPQYQGLYGSADKNGLDTAYRTLADHARMITVALTDGMFPDHNHKLRRVIRRALALSERDFKVGRGLLSELTNHVAESLAPAYPELGSAFLARLQLMIGHEERLWAELRAGAQTEWAEILKARPRLKELDAVNMPGLVKGYMELQVSKQLASEPGVLSTELAYRLYDTYGLDVAHIGQLARVERLAFDVAQLEQRLEQARAVSKDAAGRNTDNIAKIVPELKKRNIGLTDTSLRYSYVKDLHYIFPEPETQILALIQDGVLVKSVKAKRVEGQNKEGVKRVEGQNLEGVKRVEGQNKEGDTEKAVKRVEGEIEEDDRSRCCVVLDRSLLYAEAGGQQGDKGWLRLDSGADFKIESVAEVAGYVLHTGYVEDGRMHVGDLATLELDIERRIGNMRNHSATHLINAALRNILTVTSQCSSRVTAEGLSFDFSVYNEKLTADDVQRLESTVNDVIKSRTEVKRSVVTANQLLAMDHVTLMPGETYPETGIAVVEVAVENLLTSREACCGTHVLNTGDLEEMCITSLRATGAGVRSLKAVTGPIARQTIRSGRKIANKVTQMAHKVDSFLDPDDLDTDSGEALATRLLQLKRDLVEAGNLPHTVRVRGLADVDALIQRLKDGTRAALRQSVETEMKKVLLDNNEPFLVHFLRCSSALDSVPLNKATRLCGDVPVLLLTVTDSLVKARCCVPKELVSDDFNAELWMAPVLSALGASGGPPKGQNPQLAFNMRGKKVPDAEVQKSVETAVNAAKEFARSSCKAR